MNKEWLKENWFKLGILTIALMAVGSYTIYLSDRNLREEQRQQEEDALAREQADTEVWINECISDAYAELKTLQANMDAMRIYTCSLGNCRFETWEEGKREAFATYQNEWIPQCKLGNRVFIDYEFYDPATH